MKLFFSFLYFLFGVAVFAIGQNHTSEVKELRAAIEEHDSAVHVIHDWMRDPYIARGPEGTFYLSCTQNGNERIQYRKVIDHGLPLYSSENLAEWDFEGYPYTIEDAGNYEDYFQIEKQNTADPNNPTSKQALRLWAPEMHFIDGRWVIVHTSSGRYGNMIITEGGEIEKPFTMWDEKFGNQHDPSIFQEENGTCWLVTRSTRIQKLNEDLTGFAGDPVHIGPSNHRIGHEGSFIIKFKDKYLLFGTGWSTDKMRKGTYNLYYAVSDNLKGPYGKRKFAGRYLGHGNLFRDKKGRWWCSAFWNANVPPLTREEAKKKDLSDNAYTIVKKGLTLVPMEIQMVEGEVKVYAKDPDFRYPGPEEKQDFNLDR